MPVVGHTCIPFWKGSSMNRFVYGLVSLFAIAVFSLTATRSDDAPASDKADDAAQSEQAKARLKFMMDSLGEYKVEVRDGDESRPSLLLPAAALRWTNTVSGTRDGIAGVWASGGRPDVVVQFAGFGSVWNYQFQSVSLKGLTMERNGRKLWSPKEAVVLKPLPDAPAPADTAVKRMIQIRKLAERFEIVDDFHPNYIDDKIERHTLRLLSKPLYRYEANGELIDGALLGYVIATDPEAVLMIEAYKTNDGKAEWRYALAPMTVYALTAKLDGKEVFSTPDNRWRKWSTDDATCVGQHL
jgi:hypothetical protein